MMENSFRTAYVYYCWLPARMRLEMLVYGGIKYELFVLWKTVENEGGNRMA